MLIEGDDDSYSVCTPNTLRNNNIHLNNLVCLWEGPGSIYRGELGPASHSAVWVPRVEVLVS